jgi:hypothetical protein
MVKAREYFMKDLSQYPLEIRPLSEEDDGGSKGGEIGSLRKPTEHRYRQRGDILSQ